MFKPNETYTGEGGGGPGSGKGGGEGARPLETPILPQLDRRYFLPHGGSKVEILASLRVASNACHSPAVQKGRELSTRSTKKTTLSCLLYSVCKPTLDVMPIQFYLKGIMTLK